MQNISDIDPIVFGHRILAELDLPETRLQQRELIEGLIRHWRDHKSDITNGDVGALCCEAPTGTGKTYAVLCAAFTLYSMYKSKAIVSTFTKILETQYAYVVIKFREKLQKSEYLSNLWLEPELFGMKRNHAYRCSDLLRDGKNLSGPIWKWNVLKGKRNYICYRKFDTLKGLTKGSSSLKFRANGVEICEDWGALSVLIDQIRRTKKQDIDAEMSDGAYLSLLPERQLSLIRGDKWTECSTCEYRSPQTNDKKTWCQYFANQCKASDFIIINHALLYAGGSKRDQGETEANGSIHDEDSELLEALRNQNTDIEGEDSGNEKSSIYLIADEGHHLMDGGHEGGILYRWNGNDISQIYGFPLPNIPYSRTGPKAPGIIAKRNESWEKYLDSRNRGKSFWLNSNNPDDPFDSVLSSYETPPSLIGLLKNKDFDTLFSNAYISEVKAFFDGPVRDFFMPTKMILHLADMAGMDIEEDFYELCPWEVAYNTSGSSIEEKLQFYGLDEILAKSSENYHNSEDGAVELKTGFISNDSKNPQKKLSKNGTKYELYSAMITALRDGAIKAKLHLDEFLKFIEKGISWTEKNQRPITDWMAYAIEELPADFREAEIIRFDILRRQAPSGGRLLSAWRDINVPSMAVISGTLTGNSNGIPDLMSFEIESGIKVVGEPILLSSPFPEGKLHIWIPRSMPKPDQLPLAKSGYMKGILSFCVQHVPQWVRNDNGGVLILSTSKVRMRAIWEALRKELKSDPSIGLFVQLDDGNRNVAKRFLATDGKGILVASDTFREGFDAPGKALTWTILDRLPFMAPTGRSRLAEELLIESGKLSINQSSITGQSLPANCCHLSATQHRITIMSQKLAQCAGRVIRTATDEGVFTILDSRMLPDSFDHEKFEPIIHAAERYLPPRSTWITDLQLAPSIMPTIT